MNRDAVDRLIREIDPRTLVLGALALFVIALLAGGLYVVKPAWKEYDDSKRRHERAHDGFGPTGEGAAESIALLEGQVVELRDALYGGSGAVPINELEAFVVNTLDRISGHHGITLLGITPDEPTSVWMFEEMPFEVRVEGSFFAIHRWLYEVEDALRPMVVKQFELTPRRREEGVVLDMRIVAYRAPQEADA